MGAQDLDGWLDAAEDEDGRSPRTRLDLDWDDQGDSARRLKRIGVAGGLVWIAVLAVAFWVLSGDPAEEPVVPTPTSASASASATDVTAAPVPPSGTTTPAQSPSPGTTTRAATPAAVAAAADSSLDATGAVRALAEVAVRLAVSGAHEDGTLRYVDFAAAEVSVTHGPVAVVGVLAVVVEGADGTYRTTRVARYAVPVSTTDPPQVLARPWPLPAPAVDLPPDPVPTTTPDQPERIVAALERAGYADVRIVGTTTEHVPPGVLVVVVDTAGPDGTSEDRHVLWLDASTLAPLGTGDRR